MIKCIQRNHEYANLGERGDENAGTGTKGRDRIRNEKIQYKNKKDTAGSALWQFVLVAL